MLPVIHNQKKTKTVPHKDHYRKTEASSKIKKKILEIAKYGRETLKKE